MRRREFILILGGMVACPVAARGQQLRKLPTIGYLGQSTPSGESKRVTAFVERLDELGWAQARTVAIEYRWAEGSAARAAEIAAEFVRLNVTVIHTSGTPNVLATKQATSVVPIVFAVAGDPVGDGLVTSLARPGGNVTGLSVLAADLPGKRIELVREAVPGLHRLAIMGNAGNSIVAREMDAFRTVLNALNLAPVMLEIRQAEDIVPVLRGLKDRAEAIYVCQDGLTLTNRILIKTLALGEGLPSMHASREHVETGGLMSFGPNFPVLYRRSAEIVDKILRGAKPGDIPVEEPITFELVINLKTAKALGITIPTALLARADEVIE